MIINDLLKEKNMTKYKLAKTSGLPYSTVSDICNEGVEIEKCAVETVYKIAKALGVTVDKIMREVEKENAAREKMFKELGEMTKMINSMEYFYKGEMDYESFKSQTCHQLKNMGDIPFIIKLIESNAIMELFKREMFLRCLYLLALLDYLCRVNDLPRNGEYNEIRRYRMEKPAYSRDIRIMDHLIKGEDWKARSRKESIPEFAKYNIYEGEVRDVA